jgi:hypothetical protein
MEQTDVLNNKNNSLDYELDYINNYNKNIYEFGYCLKCGNPLDENMVIDRNGNKFCDKLCKDDFRLENNQDYDDVFSEFYERD